MEHLIKNQIPALDHMKNFTKEFSSESSKNLEVKRFFHGFCERARSDMKALLEVVKDNFVVSHKNKSSENWEKAEKELEKNLNSLRDESESSEKIYAAVNRISAAKDNFLIQVFKLMLYKKNILWRDLNAPYDDYIHGEIKNSINLIKANEEKYGYIPHTLEFALPKFDHDHTDSSVAEIIRIILIDHSELIEGLKNYSKLSDQPQVIEDISKNQHIVKGLRERIETLTQNYDNLMEKYRYLQISKGKVVSGPNEEKSLTEKLEEMENTLIKKEQEIIELKQASMKQEVLMGSMKEKNKELEDELSKWHKYQIPKIKEMEGNQKSILEEFNKVRRDMETYSNMLQNERDEKIKTLDDLKTEKHRVHDLANILGR
jgi:hypothetical protein